ncbi:MAG: dihydroxyacetone kinase subunit DhaL [Microcella sp.]|nr:dihydroxyacetone kinase subunit DhaL [Microcella sp.]
MTVTVAATKGWLRIFASAVAENEQLLTDLDAAIGDADHGNNLRRGTAAVVEQLDADLLDADLLGTDSLGTDSLSTAPPQTIGALLRAAGMTLVSTVGGASGVLYGTMLLRMASASDDRAELSPGDLVGALRAGLEGVRTRGRADLGDKTMVDVLAPAIDALDAALASGESLTDATSTAAIAAQAARDATAPLVARKGRASYLGERSAGHVDPGAASAALLFAALAGAIAGPRTVDDPPVTT